MTQNAPPVNYQTPSPQKGQGLAITSMVLGIVSLFFCFWYLAFPSGVIGLILGIMARKKAARGEAGGAGLALAGIICSIIGLAIDLVIGTIAIIAIIFVSRHIPTTIPVPMVPTTSGAIIFGMLSAL